MDKPKELYLTVRAIIQDVKRDYMTWVIQNPSRATDVESSVKFISYILQGRLQSKSIIISELIYCCANLLAIWHDRFIRKHLEELDASQNAKATHQEPLNGTSNVPSTSKASPCFHTSSHIRSRNTQVDRIKSALTILHYVEVFLEISARHLWGDLGRWIVVLIVQAVKTGLRSALLLHYETGMISSPTLTSHDARKGRSTQNGMNPNVVFVLKHSGRVVRKIHAAPPMNRRDWKIPEVPFRSQYVVERLPPIRMFAEMLHIMRPLAHLGTLAVWGTKSWKPWLLGLAMDISSLQLHGPPSQLRREEKAELTKRTYAILYYLLRSPFYDRFTKARVINSLLFLSSKIPVFGRIFEAMAVAIPEWQEIYSYTWSHH